MKSDFLIAVTQLAAERGIPKDMVVSAVEAALISAYKKDNLVSGYNISVSLNPGNGEIKVYALKTVVKTPSDPKKEMSLKEARKHKKDVEIGDTLEVDTDFPLAGRIAAQTAKQVVIQKLREAERDIVFNEFSTKVGNIISGRVERIEPGQIMVSLGRYEGVMPREEQVSTERYRVSQTIRLYLVEVRRGIKGPEVVLSRTHKSLLRRLFELEIPEIFNGTVEIKAVAREPGSRSKVAVAARQEGIDPVGSCVGLRGFRIQNIVNELQGEKIDVIPWHKDTSVFLSNALSPSQVLKVELNEQDKAATIVVPDKQLSLAIGRDGQNARLAAKLTGWKIDIKSAAEWEAQHAAPPEEAVATAEAVEALTPAGVAAATSGAAVQTPQEQAAAPLTESTEAEKETAEESVAPKEAPILAEVGEEIWRLPQIEKQPSTLRFAEDIMPGRGVKARDKKGTVDERESVKAKKAKRSRKLESEDEESSVEPG